MNGVLFRNTHTRSKYLTNCTKAWKCTCRPIFIQGVGKHTPRPWKNYKNSSQWLSNLVPKPKILIIQRWISVGTVASGRKNLDKSIDDDESDSELSDTIILESDNSNTLVPANKVRKKWDRNKEIPVGEKVIETLQNLFGMNRYEALETVSSAKLFHVADSAVLETLFRLDDFGITAKQIQYSPWILLQSAGEVEEKIKILTKPFLFDNILEGFGFCYFTKNRIEKYQLKFEDEVDSFPNHKNRIYHMAHQLTVPVDLFTAKIVKVENILSMSMDRIQDHMQLLSNYGFHHEDIVNNLKIFKQSIEKSERRLEAITEAGCKRPKLWQCQCSNDIFARTLDRYQCEKDILSDCTSLEEYLVERLQCTQEELRSMMDIEIVLKSVSAAKAKSVLDLLFSEGYTSEQIMHSLRLLTYSEERTAMRIKRLKDLEITSYPNALLYKSPKKFETYIKNMNIIGKQ